MTIQGHFKVNQGRWLHVRLSISDQ